MINPYGLNESYLSLVVPPDEAGEAQGASTLALVETLGDGLTPTLDSWAAQQGADRRAIEAFLLALARVGKTIQAELAALDQAAAEITVRQRRRKERLAELRTWMRVCMEGHSLRTLRDERLTLWLSANAQPSVRPLSEDLDGVPSEWLRATLVMPRDHVPEGYENDIAHVELDRVGIVARLRETGEVPPGVEVEKGSHISWR